MKRRQVRKAARRVRYERRDDAALLDDGFEAFSCAPRDVQRDLLWLASVMAQEISELTLQQLEPATLAG
ncbi:hypothetical protein [Paraburkholderia antibiotica]|uniref:Uncharacterized protein n=1 Tax=Paraburkholderia antibiotica TaxID=2728839 RepID=A0A7X9X5G9_9BURK|nr:hypothetical protein [Paraburkholderia antibiotica]NML31801.1 hypothetical protein [Paraburkholderia antibiotica]